MYVYVHMQLWENLANDSSYHCYPTPEVKMSSNSPDNLSPQGGRGERLASSRLAWTAVGLSQHSMWWWQTKAEAMHVCSLSY